MKWRMVVVEATRVVVAAAVAVVATAAGLSEGCRAELADALPALVFRLFGS